MTLQGHKWGRFRAGACPQALCMSECLVEISRSWNHKAVHKGHFTRVNRIVPSVNITTAKGKYRHLFAIADQTRKAQRPERCMIDRKTTEDRRHAKVVGVL